MSCTEYEQRLMHKL